MACDPDTLARQASCYGCQLSEKELLGAIAYLVCLWQGGGPTPPTDNQRVTPTGDVRVTDTGDVRITT